MTVIGGEIRQEAFKDALSERYLSYALSTIMARSLPDVRDGLKPVHRRLLHAMRQLRLDPDQGYKKCARVVGDVMGKYHPHGDQAIYDAMVRLAQEFAVRYPLVDGQGNFGNIDGDNAAAMRYTEARMTAVAQALLDGIDENAVDFRDTYDGEGDEPVVLPSNFPNLLANGATGIAVGMATSIPPHNVGEICDALAHLLKTPNATIAKLVALMPGPDFPTGGVLVEDRETVVEAYTSGRGSFRIRARWVEESLGRGQYQVVVTEIPYQVQKSRLVERIAELMHARKLPLLGDIREESADDIRLVLEPKSRNVTAEMLMESLFRNTDMESRFGLNMNVLDAETVPRVMDLREVLQAYLDHRHNVLVRRTKFRLEKIADRLDVLKGYMVVFLNLDEVIAVIREEDDPRAVMKKRWDLNDAQVDAILNMRLRSLRRLEEIAIREEIGGLEGEQKSLKALLRDKAGRTKRLAEEIAALKKAFGPKTELGRRRTEIADAPEPVAVPLEAMIEREPVTIVCSEKGWVRTIKGQGIDPKELKFKEGDAGKFLIPAETTDKLLVFGTNGRFYTVGVDKLPGGRGHGEPLRLMFDLGNDADIVTLKVHKPGDKLVVASSDGRGFIVPEDEVIAQTKSGKQVLNVRGAIEAVGCAPAVGDHIAILGRKRKMLVFPLSELPEMSRGRGVKLQSYASGDSLADVATFAMSEGLTTRTGDRHRTFAADELKDCIGKRAQSGRKVPKGFPSAPRFS
ncbi:MAG: DNA topoisomerase IV subunit A [Rhodospirillaceae bacterium]|jgi:topoisomerase-4 subunit A|nr:DNA topoisomerase IV subunit A [Rhodospirillaceae bacterium]MBT3808771.1 DNA topoisomerase IV subunit A [Rhodospirillaceae bacterium]MBT4772038.1 DNA topoisomerase IV subunit A [Rhodospirillaceae bacterium]MBT5357221.1 DNA topoisomerase IV subunit A [Rhodospirillaceae bacterium]MBT5770323.1 DNA topoisomerase IV subunit A [Rhodospirillaceae bacterium]